MKKNIINFLLILTIFIISSSTVYAADDIFDKEKVDKGTIGITYKSKSKLKVQITFNKQTYTYNLNGEGNKEFYPLQMGNGTYKISIYENTTGSSYKLVKSLKLDLKLEDQNIVFLGSTQNINWELNPKTIEKAAELTKDIKEIDKKAKVLWDFMLKDNKYDNNKLAKLPTTYLPVPDNTLKDKTGICYDFSSLFASMLRAQGIPAKLVKGYAPEHAVGYHAWNEVYDEVNKEWVVIDSTYDIQIKGKKTLEMKKKTEDFKKIYEY